MKKPTYIQIFSMTDHKEALNGRYQGPYAGINAETQTSEFQNGSIVVSRKTRYQNITPHDSEFETSKIVMAYRHTDTGALKGTSESLFVFKNLPWLDIPGLEVHALDEVSGAVKLRLWNQDVQLFIGRVVRVHFAKTIVYLKNFGPSESGIRFVDENLSFGPAHLHAEEIDDNLTMAPPSGSGIVVKMGQEIEH